MDVLVMQMGASLRDHGANVRALHIGVKAVRRRSWDHERSDVKPLLLLARRRRDAWRRMARL